VITNDRKSLSPTLKSFNVKPKSVQVFFSFLKIQVQDLNREKKFHKSFVREINDTEDSVFFISMINGFWI